MVSVVERSIVLREFYLIFRSPTGFYRSHRLLKVPPALRGPTSSYRSHHLLEVPLALGGFTYTTQCQLCLKMLVMRPADVHCSAPPSLLLHFEVQYKLIINNNNFDHLLGGPQFNSIASPQGGPQRSVPLPSLIFLDTHNFLWLGRGL